MKHWLYFCVQGNPSTLLSFTQKVTSLLSIPEQEIRIDEDHSFLYPEDPEQGGGTLIAFPVEGTREMARLASSKVWSESPPGNLWQSGVYKRAPVSKKNSLKFHQETKVIPATTKTIVTLC